MVIKGNVDKSAFKEAFKSKSLDENADVQKFLDQMVGDNQGLIHLFDWGGLIDQKKGLGETFQVPNLETGKMEKLITGDDDGALTALEEEQFRNMVNRLHTIFKVKFNRLMIQFYFKFVLVCQKAKCTSYG